jgi:DNA-binding Lrp family transcriptional regulator
MFMERTAPEKYNRATSTVRNPVEAERSIIDALDARILRHMLVDGRISFRRLARELHVSTNTVASRVSRLEKSGAIRGFCASVDFEKVGYALTAVTEIIVSKGKLLEMEGQIAKLPGVCAVYDVTGEIDGVVIAKFKGREELSHFTKGLLALPFIERANTHVVLTTVREDFRLAV